MICLNPLSSGTELDDSGRGALGQLGRSTRATGSAPSAAQANGRRLAHEAEQGAPLRHRGASLIQPTPDDHAAMGRNLMSARRAASR